MKFELLEGELGCSECQQGGILPDGSVPSAGEVFEGSTVLVTIPLGCLKAGDVTFDPPLMRWKQDAIKELGFGFLNKVRLVCCAALLWKYF